MRALNVVELGYVAGGYMPGGNWETAYRRPNEKGEPERDEDYNWAVIQDTGPNSVSITAPRNGNTLTAFPDFNSYCPDGMDGPACYRPGESFATYMGRFLQNPIQSTGQVIGSVDWRAVYENWRRREDHYWNDPLWPNPHAPRP